jgi:hypothetical protein
MVSPDFATILYARERVSPNRKIANTNEISDMPGTKIISGTFATGIPYVKFGTGPKTMLFFAGGPGNHIPSGLGASGLVRGMRAFTDEYTIVLVTEMITDPISTKRTASLGPGSVAYIDEGSGPPVLLLHECPFWSDVWRKTIVHLGPHFRCIAPDLLGLGDTETPLNTDWTLPAQAAMVLELLDRLGPRRVHVVGHDHGGAIALILAAKHPEVIDRLVLINVGSRTTGRAFYRCASCIATTLEHEDHAMMARFDGLTRTPGWSPHDEEL